MTSFPTQTSTSFRSVAILTGPSTHLDHLGVLSAVLEIPLIVTDEKTLELCKRYYPQINATFMEIGDLSMQFLSEHFDVIFETGKFFALELKSSMKLLFSKEMQFVFCPHGNSDKGLLVKDHPDQDLSLVYGDHLFDHLKKTNALDQSGSIVATGNYRHLFYEEHKSFYDDLVEKEICSHLDPHRKTILYAPTWQSEKDLTLFFNALESFISEFKSSYNLLIKLHPFLIEDHLCHVLAMQYRYEDTPFIRFIDDFPVIYPLLNCCDIYVGDYSSIGYDFLAFDRPLYFFDPFKNQVASSLLVECGIEIPSEKGLNQFLEKTLGESQNNLQKKRKELYAYSFGKRKPFSVLRKEIFGALEILMQAPS